MQENGVHKPTARVLDILALLGSNPEGYTLTEIADLIHAAKGTIFPILHTMNDRKFILQDVGTGKYRIGISSFCVGESYTNNKTVMQFITEEMHSIVNQVGEICQMGVLDNGEVLYVAKVDNKEAIRLISHVGKRLPAYCTALGKALLSTISIADIKKLYPNGLKSYTPNTIDTFKKLENAIAETKKTGIASESEEIAEHLCCLAVPLCVNGKAIAALSVSSPTFRSTREKDKLIKKVLLCSKEKIETYFNTEHFDINDFIFN